MKDSGKRAGGKGKLSASFMTGAVALVFLVIGYQTALFVHKAAIVKILSNRDHPDTVYVIEPELARAVLAEAAAGDGKYSFVSGREHFSKENGFNAGTGNSGGIGYPSSVGFGKTDGTEGNTAFGNEAVPDRNNRIVIRKDSPHSPEVEAIRSAHSSRTVESFTFNPNTVSVEDLVRLGFSERQAVSIDNYRKKGGKFRRRSDFAKSFVVADSVYRRLEPYIDIPLVDLNLADSAEFDALPGIGGYFAARMVEYRERLGGSYSYKEQLMDIRNFDREKYDGLSDLITVDSTHVRPYPLWTLPEDSLRMHPYIGSYAVAHGIVIFRENSPVSSWTVQSLEKAGVISSGAAAKLSRCRIALP